MKKILIGSVAVAMCVTLTACGTSANDVCLNNLGNQLDRTANTISNIQTINPTDLNITPNSLETIASKDNRLYSNVINTQQSLISEEYYKMDILNKTAKIKNNLGKDIKLSKAQTNAVKELTSNLTKYTNSVGYTRNEMNSTVKSIVSMKKDVTKNNEKINAKLNRLACNSNTRACYYENILKTLEQIENELCINDFENHTHKNEKDNSNENNNSLTKNIDSYLPKNSNDNENCDNCDKCDKNQNFNNVNSYTPIQPNPIANEGMIYGGGYGNRFYGNQYGYYGNPYNSNNLNRYNRFNPSRNTDTYAPFTRNIDTYRGYYGSGYNNFGINNTPATIPATTENNPEERLESFEEIKDGAIEKIETTNNDSETSQIFEKESFKTEEENNIEKTNFSSNNLSEKEIPSDVNENVENQKTTNSTYKTPKIRIVDVRNKTQNVDENQTIVAHDDVNSKIENLMKD